MKWARLLLVLVMGAGVASALEAKGVAQSMLPNAPRCQTDASLAAEYMQKAETWYREVIDYNPEDSHSLYSLAEVIMAQASGSERAVEIEKLMTKSAESGNLAAMEYLVHEYAEDEGMLPGNMIAYARWC